MHRVIALAVAALWLAAPAAQQLTVRRITPTVYWASGGGGNSGIVVGATGVIVIDAKNTPLDGRALVAEVAKLTPKPITHVILTSSDADHVSGLSAFPADLTVVAYEAAKRQMETPRVELAAPARGARGVAPVPAPKAPPAPKAAPAAPPPPSPPPTRLPTKLISGLGEVVTINGVKLDLRHWAPAHTSGDLVVVIPDQGIVFTGDVVTTDKPDPVVRLEKGGSSEGWISTVKGMLGLPATKFVPGHGDLTLKAEVQTRLDASLQKRDQIAELVRQGKTAADVRAAVGEKTPPAADSFAESVLRELGRR